MKDPTTRLARRRTGSTAGKLGPLTYQLQPWQEDALTAWRNSTSPDRGRRNGVAEVYTGAGKTIFAMACMAAEFHDEPDLQFAIVAPTRAMARQWQRALSKGFGLSESDIGLCMSGQQGTLKSQHIVVYVINSARKRLAQDALGRKVMLVVDECHRAGSRENLSIFEANTVHRLGLSATASRDDMVDEVGNLIPVEQQPHIRAIGPIFYRLDIKRARELGLLPRYTIHHHRLPMTSAEAKKYDQLCQEVAEYKDEARRSGISPEASSRFCRRPPPHATPAQIAAARALQAALFRRKQWLYGVASRNEVARLVLRDAATRLAANSQPLRGLAFNERIDPWEEADAEPDGDPRSDEGRYDDDAIENADEPASQADDVTVGGAAALFEQLRSDARAGLLAVPTGENGIAIYHSRLKISEREIALQEFGKGTTSILVSVKALIEGIDVPDANLGISVASTSSGRQRIQTMGRILRAPRDVYGNPLPAAVQATLPAKEIHLLYVGGTVDEEIYIRSNWSDLTGEAENKWWRWEHHDQALTKLTDMEPPKPPLTEEEVWQSIAEGPMPTSWAGSTSGSLWSYRQNAIFSQIDTEVLEPSEAIALLESAANHIGDCRGKFVVTPRLNVLLKKRADAGGWFAIGKLSKPLKARSRDATTQHELNAPQEPHLNTRDNDLAISPQWPAQFRAACQELRRDGQISPSTLETLATNQDCPPAVFEAMHAANTADPATRDPEGIRTKALLTDMLVSLRIGATGRAAACAAALRGRSETWCSIVTSEVEQAVTRSTSGESTSSSIEQND